MGSPDDRRPAHEARAAINPASSPPSTAGRWIVRGVRDGELGIAGTIEDGADGCTGARVALQVVEIPAGRARTTAGPTGLARPSRLPVSP
jgi:hypothetical protein